MKVNFFLIISAKIPDWHSSVAEWSMPWTRNPAVLTGVQIPL